MTQSTGRTINYSVSRVEFGRVRRYSKRIRSDRVGSGRVGPSQEVFKISRVESGEVK